jgi:hypothetical protein
MAKLTSGTGGFSISCIAVIWFVLLFTIGFNERRLNGTKPVKSRKLGSIGAALGTVELSNMDDVGLGVSNEN